MMPLRGLARRLRELFARGGVDEGLLEGLEDALVEADLGARVAAELVGRLREELAAGRTGGREQAVGLLRAMLRDMIVARALELPRGTLTVLLVLGVNGVGKTTTIAKLAHWYRRTQGISSTILVAGDTFRAAAIDQLRVLGERLGLPVVAQEPGADPGAVLFDGIAHALLEFRARRPVEGEFFEDALAVHGAGLRGLLPYVTARGGGSRDGCRNRGKYRSHDAADRPGIGMVPVQPATDLQAESDQRDQKNTAASCHRSPHTVI